MRVVYVLSKYPCSSETFIAREIRELVRGGAEVVVVADGADEGVRADAAVVYRPGNFTLRAMWGLTRLAKVGWKGLRGLMGVFFSVLVECPREAVTLAVNLGSILWVAREVSTDGAAGVVHAGFLSRPAVVGMGLAAVLGREFSVACHARDVFVESGAVRAKLRACRFAVVCNAGAFEYLVDLVGDEERAKLTLLRHGVELSAGNVGWAGGGDIVAAVGRFVEKKGFGYLIEAFAEVKKCRRGVELWLIGDGPMRRELVTSAADAGVSGDVYFTGWQDQGKVGMLLECCSVLVVPSVVAEDGDVDGVCNVLLEACLRGKCVVGSCFGGSGEVVEDGISGRIVDPRDAAGLAEAIVEVLGDKVRAGEMGERARRKVESEYSLSENVLVLAGLFGEAAK